MNALAMIGQSTSAMAMFSPEQVQVIKDLICPGASDLELELFASVCKRTGLDPLAKQIFGIMRWDGRKKREVMSIQTSIDGFRLQAQRSGDYAGQEGPQWCGEDGVWRDVWLSKEAPSAARVGVYRKGWSRPAWGIATWSEYAQTNKDGQVTGLWRGMPANMLAKCAESQALRKAFPAELSSLYSRDEMGQADNEPAEIIAAAPPSDFQDGIAYCDAEHFNKAWHAAVKGSRFEDDETRHKFLSWYTKGSCSSLADFLKGSTTDEAARLIAGIQRSIEAEAKKARAALEAEARQVIEDAQAAGAAVDAPEDLAELSDAEIREMVDPLKEALASLEAVPA